MVIFLDFDGVLHSAFVEKISDIGLEAFYAKDARGVQDRILSGDFFHPDKIELIYNTILPYVPKIVISSTWRRDFTMEELKRFLGKLGEFVVDITGEAERRSELNQRHSEIRAYIDKHDLGKKPFVIIDDDKLLNFYIHGRQVMTSSRVGFTKDDELSLNNILKDASVKPAGYFDRVLNARNEYIKSKK